MLVLMDMHLMSAEIQDPLGLSHGYCELSGISHLECLGLGEGFLDEGFVCNLEHHAWNVPKKHLKIKEKIRLCVFLQNERTLD